MEACGSDVYRMVAAAGWDIHPIGSGAKPADIPKGTLAGIVIVQKRKRPRTVIIGLSRPGNPSAPRRQGLVAW